MSSGESGANERAKAAKRTAFFLRVCGLAGALMVIIISLICLARQGLYVGGIASATGMHGGGPRIQLAVSAQILVIQLSTIVPQLMYAACVWFFCGYFARMLEQYAGRLEGSGSPGHEAECGAGERG